MAKLKKYFKYFSFFYFPEKTFSWTSPLRVLKEARPDFGKAMQGPLGQSAVVFPAQSWGLSATKKIPEKTEVFSPSGGKFTRLWALWHRVR
jgi:hypothetical protein